jgi:photosystem II stability/assembly factor-like uncharacterized protein
MQNPYFVGLCVTLFACSSSSTEQPAADDTAGPSGPDGSAGTGTGGRTGDGGGSGGAKVSGSGGALGSGGKAGSGGSVGSGGAAASGGATGSGGSAGASGTPLPHDSGVPPADVAAPPSGWINVTNNLFTLAAGGGDVSVISAKPDMGRVIAGVGKGKGLFFTDDGGKTWAALGTGAGSSAINNGPTAVVYDPDHTSTWWEVGIYGNGVFKTTDDGLSFAHLGDSYHNDLVSIDFTDPARKTLLLGAHETAHKLFLSGDGGNTWTDIGSKLPADSNFSTLPLILDTKTFLVGSCGYGSGACGVFRSTDGGTTWTRAATQGPVARPLWASNGTIYWDLIYDGGMITSTDGGSTWIKAGAGPVSIYYSSSPVELPDGRVVTVGKDHLLATSDGGKTWKAIGNALPFPGANCGTYGVTYSAWLKTFFINHNDCTGNIISNSVYSSGFDYTVQ